VVGQQALVFCPAATRSFRGTRERASLALGAGWLRLDDGELAGARRLAG